MFILRIIMVLTGLVFVCFGYAIWVKQKYSLINNFDNDKKNGKLDDSFDKRVGKIELIGGLVCFVLGIFNMFMNDFFTLAFFVLSIISIVVALLFNQVKSTK